MIDTILNNFYVDDCLNSVPSEDKGVSLPRDVKALCLNGGFQLTKWISNSRLVLASIPEDERAKDHNSLPMEWALGVKWCIKSHTFKFRIIVNDWPHTRRRILSVVSSVYEPLGFLAPFILPATLILQELCRMKCSWDEDIPKKYLQQ